MAGNNLEKKLIRLSKSVITELEKKAVLDVLDNGYLGMGSKVKLFEENLSLFLNRPVACVSSGTSALHLALQACEIGKGDEVLVQSLTYVASFQAISATGATPVPCDIELDTFSLSVEDMKKRITSETKAIMPMHYGGALGRYEEIYKFAEENNLRVIEDAAHAFGTRRNNKVVGSFGDIVCFSFDGIKNITCGEGGCVVSNDLEVLNKVKDARLLGVEKDTEHRFKDKRSWDFQVNNQGWRYHMSDIMAAIGISQLSKFDHFAYKRRYLAKFYDSYFKSKKSFSILPRDYDQVVPHIYPLVLSKEINRNDFQDYLLKNNIQTGIHYKPNHLLEFYKYINDFPLKNTESIYKRIVTLPLHPELEVEDLNYIFSCIASFLNEMQI